MIRPFTFSTNYIRIPNATKARLVSLGSTPILKATKMNSLRFQFVESQLIIRFHHNWYISVFFSRGWVDCKTVYKSEILNPLLRLNFSNIAVVTTRKEFLCVPHDQQPFLKILLTIVASPTHVVTFY